MNFESPRNPRKNSKSKVRGNRRRRSANSRQKPTDYQQLEARNLLAVEIGLNFTGAIGGTDSVAANADISGSIGENFAVEMINSSVRIYNKADGALINSETLDDFWVNAGATSGSGFVNPQIIYDQIEGRWFASAANQTFPNEIFVAISETDDPNGDWNSVQFQADVLGASNGVDTVLSVDANGLYVTTVNPPPFANDVSIFSIPKRDLLGSAPSILRITRFEHLDTAQYGNNLHVGLDNDANPRAVLLGTFEGGSTSIARTDIVGTSGPGAGLSIPVNITVPFYEAAPDARQPDATTLDNASPEFTGSIVREGNFMFAAHAVMGSDSNSAIRWYKFDLATNTLADHGTIEDTSLDYFHPSISVNEYGVIMIGFTASGPDQFASAMAVSGFTVNGLQDPVIEFGEPNTLRNGLDNVVGSTWGERSSTVLDPVDPFSFWTFTEYANNSNTWSTRVSETGLFDVNPTVRANDNNNDIIVRTSPTNSEWVEIEIDGMVTDVFERRSMTALNIDAGDGDDTFTIDLSFGLPLPFSGITARGGDGVDVFEVSGGTVGNSWIVNGDGAGVVDGEMRFFDFEEIQAGDNDDMIEIRQTGTDLVVRGGEGNDEIFVTGFVAGQLTLRGEAGDDLYRLPIESITSIIVIDSLNDENDVLNAFATPGNDEITLSNSTIQLNGATTADFIADGVELIEIDALNGNDTINIISTDAPYTFFGSGGNDTFIVSSNTGSIEGNADSIGESMTIDGGTGSNQLVVTAFTADPKSVTVTDTMISGLAANDIAYTSTGGNFDLGAGIILHGSNLGDDSFVIESSLAGDEIRIEGHDGADMLTVRDAVLGNVELDGQAGEDTYRVAMTNMSIRIVSISDTGVFGEIDRVVATLTDNQDVLRVEDEQIVVLNEKLELDSTIESFVVSTLGGNDIVTIGNNDIDNVRVIGGDGNETFTVEGTRDTKGVRLEGNEGDDSFDVERSVAGTFLIALGGRGNDSISVENQSFASGRLDGQDGSDDILVDLVGRTNRVLNARDTGTSGTDNLTITGTGGIDRYFLRQQSLTNFVERVLFNGNTEELVASPNNGNDIITIFGSLAPSTVINTGQGDDLVIVESTAGADEIIISSGTNNDRFTVRSTAPDSTLILRGEEGDDTFRVGSTGAEDNGNLGRIRGRVTINGGNDVFEDRLLVNDALPTAEFDYFVSDTQVANLTGPNSIERDVFAGVSISELEYVRVDGTSGANQFNVRPSQTTRFYIDGNSPTADEGGRGDFLNLLGDSTDGRNLTSAGDGSGVWKFTNGNEEVRFENIETNTIPRSRIAPQMMTAGGSSSGSENLSKTSNPDLTGSVELDEGSDEGRSFTTFVDDVFAQDDDFGFEG